MERSTVQSCLAAPFSYVKSISKKQRLVYSAPADGTCTQNKARNGVHFRAKSVQQIREPFLFGNGCWPVSTLVAAAFSSEARRPIGAGPMVVLIPRRECRNQKGPH
jgi:hypothetical protein